MSDSPEGFFRGHFSHLSDGLMPYAWQQKLFADFISDRWPDSIGLPTGAGKTAIIKIWLIALGWSLRGQAGNHIPRRLIWVVNRRVVVDQATSEVRAVTEKLAPSELGAILRGCSVSNRKIPLAVSTLRGQMADNREWSYDPMTPAVIIGTVDMIGSRLLFRGYRDGKYSRPQHAGLLGVDTLIANDESHLTPAFVALLSRIAEMKPAAETGRPFRVLFVSATQANGAGQPFHHNLDEDIAENSNFRRLYDAEKCLIVEQPADNTSLLARMREIALASDSKRTILFVESPEKAADLAAQLQKSVGAGRVALLTGTMRGYERDQLTESPVFKAFAEPRSPQERQFLVTTSAGEVGVNISGELLITQLQESDHLAQRFGRLNRFGDQDGELHRVGHAHVIPAAREKDEGRNARLQATLSYLNERLPKHPDGSIDISCHALYENPAPQESRSKQPKLALLDQRLIQAWSQTTFPNDRVEPVDSWLHGQQEDDYPEAEIAWRAELEYLVQDEVSNQDRKKALDTYRILPHETLREPSSRLFQKLERLSVDERNRKILIQWRSRDVEAKTIDELIREREQAPARFRDALVILRPGMGKLSHGIFHPTDGEAAQDIADLEHSPGEARERWVVEKRVTEEEWTLKRLGRGEEPASFPETGRVWKLQVNESDEERDRPERLLLFVTRIDAEKKKRREVLLNDHLNDVKQQAARLAAAAFPDLVGAYETAGQHHDEGKRCELWQIAMGNTNGRPAIAKSNRPGRPRLLEGYRHELASVLHCLNGQNNIDDDLALHLIASHHGWARPYWEARAYGPDHNLKDEGRTALDAARRFSRLQEKYGPWGLAYLEALFKAADGIASSVAEGDSTR